MADGMEYINAREEYIELIKRELLGPGSEVSIPDAKHELISSSPIQRYSVGILFPRNNKMNSDNNDVETGNGIDGNDEGLMNEEENEEITGAPPESYTENDDKNADNAPAPDEGDLDEEVSLAAQNKPSSFGVMFYVNGNTDRIHVSLEYGKYKRATIKDCRVPLRFPENGPYGLPPEFGSYLRYDGEEGTVRMVSRLSWKEIRELKEKYLSDTDVLGLYDIMIKLNGQLNSGFVRDNMVMEDIEIIFGGDDYTDKAVFPVENEDIRISALRNKTDDGRTAVTIMVVNAHDGKENGANCIFQPVLTVHTEKNDFVFTEYGGNDEFAVMDKEEKSLALQYRNKHVYGSGLGTAVNWNVDSEGRGEIHNDFFPEYEVPSMDFGLSVSSGVPKEAFSMKALSDLDERSREEKIGLMKLLVDAYGNWIEKTDSRIKDLDKKYHETAEANMKGCRDALKRMNKGLKILETDDKAWDAFQLANRAMFIQRVQLAIQKKHQSCITDGSKWFQEIIEDIDYRTADREFNDPFAWRPFQLAFIIMDVASITGDDDGDRELVDLIWFPTGGGKTEAYLGLTAFTIFYRRLAHPDESDGTTVIMRYTLRLLTSQQFTRASTLICACEYIRRDAASRKPRYGRYSLGKESITIGLWIGGAHTPNKNDDAEKCVSSLLKARGSSLEYEKRSSNKFQVLKCPWCGEKMLPDYDAGTKKVIGKWGYAMEHGHFRMACPNESCPFNGSLPVQVVDEELYAKPPTLLFATVDKFAMLPFIPEIGRFFGKDSVNRAPELIIQDELHLISGPLGTMVGLYETVIDAMCGAKGVKPKIIASTATIRRAAEQCASLYDRKTSQFPHPGIDAEDSFFSREAEVNLEKGVFGRKYVGIMPAGRTKATMEAKTIAALLQKIQDMELPDEVKDKYWTETAYYNSMKDLGKGASIVSDDAKDAMRRMVNRLKSHSALRKIASYDELTSRTNTTLLNETLDKLEKTEYSGEGIKNGIYPSNILLATNMISVGIDVARLNVMLIVGQPKLTSEYIQASSRVGRKYPGVVFTMYDGSKSRDRSHFEQFRSYHQSFYRFVEPTGVTPFSKPSRDRALHALIVAWLRFSEQTLSEDKSAGDFDVERYADSLKAITDFIVNREKEVTGMVDPNMKPDTADILNEIEDIVNRWREIIDDASDDPDGILYYGRRFLVNGPKDHEYELMKTFGVERKDFAFPTMTSMRNVDSMVRSNIIEWEDPA